MSERMHKQTIEQLTVQQSDQQKELKGSRIVLVSVVALHLALLSLVLWQSPRTNPEPLPVMMGALVPAETEPRPIQNQPKQKQPKPVKSIQPTKAIKPSVEPIAKTVEKPVAASPQKLLTQDQAKTETSNVTPTQSVQTTSTSDVAKSTSANSSASNSSSGSNTQTTTPRSDAAHLNNPQPAYPKLSRQLEEQGKVLLDVYVLADGTVGELKLKRSSGYARLDQSAMQAVKRWKFIPAKKGGEPLSVWYVQPIEFNLSNS